MSSRIDVDPHGRRIVVVVDATSPDLPPGMRFVVRGNSFDSEGRLCWLGAPTGRPSLPSEMMSGGYCVPQRKPKPPRPPEDDEISDEDALRFCFEEQRRRPPDLIAA
jgi:hypothetical protein